MLDNPFLLTPYRTADGRWIMASGVYPHLAAKWCRFLDVPPNAVRVAAAIAGWDAVKLEEAANAAGLPACVIASSPNGWRTRTEHSWSASRSSAWSAPATARRATSAGTPAVDGIRVLSFTHAIAGPVVGRTLAEHGADVLCTTRPNDYEHEFIYAEANPGSRSAYLDLANPAGQQRAAALLAETDIVVSNHRSVDRWNARASSRAGSLRRFHPGTGRRPHARPARSGSPPPHPRGQHRFCAPRGSRHEPEWRT